MNRWMQKGTWGLALGLALVLSRVQGAAAQAGDPAAVLIAFERAVGSAPDVDAALALWADNGVQKITPPPQGTSGLWTGKVELRQAFEYAVAHKVQRELVGSPQVTGNRVTYVSRTTNDVFLLWGVAPVQFNTEAVVENGKITAYSTSIVPSEGARVGAAAAAYQAAHAAPPAQPAPDPAAVVTAFERAVGSAPDVDAALALWADNGVQQITPPPQGTSGHWTGKTELRQAFEYAVAHKVQRTIVGSPQVDGHRVTYTAMVSNDVFARLGVTPVQFTTEAVVEGGKITSYTTSIVPSEGARVAAAVAAAQPPAQPPPGMPSTGGNDSTLLLAGLLGIGLLCVGAGAVTRRVRSQA